MNEIKQGRVPAADFIWPRIHPKNEIAEKLVAFSEATGTKLPVAVQSRIKKVEEATARYQRAKELHQEALDRKTHLERYRSEEELTAALDTEPEAFVAVPIPDVPAANHRVAIYERAVLTRLADLVAEVDYRTFYKTLTKAWDNVVEFPRPPEMTLAELAEKEAQVAEARRTCLEIHRAIVNAKLSGPNELIREFRTIPELVDAEIWWWDKTERPAAERAEALRVHKEKEQAAREARAAKAAEVAQFRAGTHEAQQASDEAKELVNAS